MLILAAAAPYSHGSDNVDVILEKVYTSPHEANGDYDLYVKDLAQLFKDNIRSPAAGVIYNKMIRAIGKAANPTILDDIIDDVVTLSEKEKLPNGLLHSLILIQKRNISLRKGRVEEADALKVFTPWAKNILAIGPFGFNASYLHDVLFRPEQSLEELNTVNGFSGPVDWIKVTRSPDESGFNLNRFIYPRKGSTYGLYQFETTGTEEVLIIFRTSGSAKLWYNGSLVKDIDRRKSYIPNKFILPVTATKGWNRLLIKFSSNRSSFSLKITDRSGFSVPGLKEMEEIKLAPMASKNADLDQSFSLAEVDTLSFLRDYAKEHADNPFASLALAETLSSNGLDSNAVHEGEHALSLAMDNPFCMHLLARIYMEAPYLPRNYKINRAQELLKKTMEDNENFLPAYVTKAIHEHQNDRSEDAVKLIRSVIEKNPKYYSAVLVLTDIFDSLGWQKELLTAVKEANKIGPLNPNSHILMGQYYQSLSRKDIAYRHFKKALDLDDARTDLLEWVAAYHWNRNERAEAFALYEKCLTISKSDFNRERMAGLHIALGDHAKAREIYEMLKDKNPKYPKYYTRLGDLDLAMGEFDSATKWYSQSLELAPENHALRETLQDWGKLEEDLFTEYDPEEMIDLENIPGKEEYPKASSICALDHMITKVYKDGSIKTEIYQVIKILDKDAVENYGRYPVQGRIVTLQVINPDGKVYEPVDAERSGIFNLPGLDVGSIIKIRHILQGDNSVGDKMRLGRFFFQDPDCKQPFLTSKHVVSIPKSMKMSVERKIPESYQEEQIDKGDDIVYVFIKRRSPVAIKEKMMPPDEESFPSVDFYQPGDWRRTAQHLVNSVIPALKPTKEISNKAMELTNGIETDLKKAELLYNFVNEHVTDDRGSSAATTVLLEGRGSRGALFMALLDASSVKYDYLRCGVTPGYNQAVEPVWTDVNESLLPNELVRILPKDGPPKMLAFNSRLTPFGEIPPQAFGAPMMKVTGKPEKIEMMPGGGSDLWLDEVTELSVKVDLLDAKITGSFYLPGFSRIRFRESLQRMDSHARKQTFENRILRTIYPGAEVQNLKILGIDDDDKPPMFSFELLAKDFIQPTAGKEGCTILPRPTNFTRIFINETERKFPYLYRDYSSIKFIMDIDFNDKFEIAELPESLVQRCFFLNYSLIISRTEKGARIERTIEFSPADIQPERYGELVEALRIIDEREVAPIILKQKLSNQLTVDEKEESTSDDK